MLYNQRLTKSNCTQIDNKLTFFCCKKCFCKNIYKNVLTTDDESFIMRTYNKGSLTMIRELYREYIALPSEEDEPITLRGILEMVVGCAGFIALAFCVMALSVIIGG